MFRQHRLYRKALTLMVLLSLLMQVQTVFACQMMEHSGHAEHCCCDEMVSTRNSDHNTEHDSPCCDFSSEIVLKDPQLEDSQPVNIQQNHSLELPLAAIVYILANLWPLDVAQSTQSIIWDFNNDPDDPGSDTYLSTLRLRI